jgi:hypothetical protein
MRWHIDGNRAEVLDKLGMLGKLGNRAEVLNQLGN